MYIVVTVLLKRSLEIHHIPEGGLLGVLAHFFSKES